MARQGRALAALALAAFTTPVLAAESLPCAQTRDVIGALHSSFGELPVSSGLQRNGQLLQFFASPQTGTWTAVTTSPDGVSCILATGQRWSEPSPASSSNVPEG